MDGMKSNRKFKQEDEAVSAVIGVILMVAITVAIAATVYVYVSGMIGTSPEQTPNMQLVKDGTARKLTVASADPGNLAWSDFVVSVQNESGGNTWNSGDNVTDPGLLVTSYPSGDTVTAGDIIKLHASDGTAAFDELTVTIRHTPTNTLIGTWEFN
jgi:flagellin-like protein